MGPTPWGGGECINTAFTSQGSQDLPDLNHPANMGLPVSNYVDIKLSAGEGQPFLVSQKMISHLMHSAGAAVEK